MTLLRIAAVQAGAWFIIIALALAGLPFVVAVIVTTIVVLIGAGCRLAWIRHSENRVGGAIWRRRTGLLRITREDGSVYFYRGDRSGKNWTGISEIIEMEKPK